MSGGSIVLISGKDPLGEGGHESYARAHALAAQSAGYEPHVFCAAGRSGLEPTDFGVIHRVRTPPHRTAPALLSVPVPACLPFLARAVTGFLAGSSRARVIHSFGIYAGAGALASHQLARQGVTAIPVASAFATFSYEARGSSSGVQDYHGLGHRLRYGLRRRWVDAVDDRIEGWGYAHSRLILINYESVRQILVDAYGPGLNLRRVPYCAPDAFARAAAAAPPVPDCVRALTPPDAPLLVCTSRHAGRKGTDVLLRALGRVRDSGIAFRACLLGPGILLEAHRRLASELGLAGQVVLPGAVPEVEPYLTHGDLFALPSLVESSGSVSVLEALGAGLPVVSSACDGIPEDLTDAVDALLVPPGDTEALARALGRLLTDPQLRAELGANALRTYQRRFSAEPLTAALGEIYATLGAGTDADRELARIAAAT